jgi:hypothetical protein
VPSWRSPSKRPGNECTSAPMSIGVIATWTGPLNRRARRIDDHARPRRNVRDAPGTRACRRACRPLAAVSASVSAASRGAHRRLEVGAAFGDVSGCEMGRTLWSALVRPCLTQQHAKAMPRWASPLDRWLCPSAAVSGRLAAGVWRWLTLDRRERRPGPVLRTTYQSCVDRALAGGRARASQSSVRVALADAALARRRPSASPSRCPVRSRQACAICIAAAASRGAAVGR